MRIHPVLPLVVGLAVSACDDTGGPSQPGRLVVSTVTEGEDPDQDGYRLAIDDLDTLALASSGTAATDVPSGAHTLRLLGVAEHCSVAPGISLDVEIAAGSTTPVGFAIDCPATGVRITAPTTGLDLDNGYRFSVNTVAWGGILANGVVLLRLAPGEWTIAVTDIAPNCAMEGPHSRTVTVVDREVVPLEFAVVCTVATGVIGVIVEAEGIDLAGEYVATVDGSRHPVQLGRPTYLTGIAFGDHVVDLIPPTNCSVQTDPQSITLSAGGMVRDTAEVSFSVSCVSRLGVLQVSAHTTGTPQAHDYSVWVCEAGFYCQFYPYLLGGLAPNGTLVAEVQPGSYEIWLDDVPGTCGVIGPRSFTIALRDTLDLVYSVSCP